MHMEATRAFAHLPEPARLQVLLAMEEKVKGAQDAHAATRLGGGGVGGSVAKYGGHSGLPAPSLFMERQQLQQLGYQGSSKDPRHSRHSMGAPAQPMVIRSTPAGGQQMQHNRHSMGVPPQQPVVTIRSTPAGQGMPRSVPSLGSAPNAGLVTGTGAPLLVLKSKPVPAGQLPPGGAAGALVVDLTDEDGLGSRNGSGAGVEKPAPIGPGRGNEAADAGEAVDLDLGLNESGGLHTSMDLQAGLSLPPPQSAAEREAPGFDATQSAQAAELMRGVKDLIDAGKRLRTGLRGLLSVRALAPEAGGTLLLDRVRGLAALVDDLATVVNKLNPK